MMRITEVTTLPPFASLDNSLTEAMLPRSTISVSCMPRAMAYHKITLRL